MRRIAGNIALLAWITSPVHGQTAPAAGQAAAGVTQVTPAPSHVAPSKAQVINSVFYASPEFLKDVAKTLKPGEVFSRLKATSRCKNEPPETGITIPSDFADDFAARRTNIIRPGVTAVNCYREGDTVNVFAVPPRGRFVNAVLIGSAVIMEIYETRLGSIPEKFLKAYGIDQKTATELAKGMEPFRVEKPEPVRQYIFVKYSTTPLRNPQVGVAPRFHPFAKIITAAEAKAMIGRTPAPGVADVRSKSEFAAGALPGAVNVDLPLPRMMKPIFTEADRGKTVPPNILPVPRTSPVIIYGADPADARPLLALANFLKMGFNDQYWLYGGYQEWLGGSIHVPKDPPPKVKVITALNQLPAQQLKNALLIDPRPAAQFALAHPVGATNIPYMEAKSEAGIAKLRRPGLTYAKLSQAGDKFELARLPHDTNRPLVFYQYDEGTWEAYKAAVWASARGWKNVSLLRPRSFDPKSLEGPVLR
jgi:rhodanese-related sulfurtransferase